MSALAYIKVPVEIVQTHEDPGEWCELMCYGAMQPEHGHFATRGVMDTLLGRARARRCVDRGDVQALPDGRWLITDWDFQEGDRTVTDRMKRYRDRVRSRQGAQKLFPLSTIKGGRRRNAGYGRVTG